MYLFGCQFTVETDYKMLEAMKLKTLLTHLGVCNRWYYALKDTIWPLHTGCATICCCLMHWTTILHSNWDRFCQMLPFMAQESWMNARWNLRMSSGQTHHLHSWKWSLMGGLNPQMHYHASFTHPSLQMMFWQSWMTSSSMVNHS